MLGLFIIFCLVIGVIICISSSNNQPAYTPPVSRPRYTSRDYDDMDDDEDLLFDDDDDDDNDIHDTGEIFDHFQDGTCSKSDMELLMEDDDIRDEFYGDF